MHINIKIYALVVFSNAPLVFNYVQLEEHDNITDFKRVLLEENYVDKTEFVSEFFKMPIGAYLITQPKGFGKSLSMNMVKRFVELEIDKNGKPLPAKKKENEILFKGGVILHEGQNKTVKGLQIWENKNIVKQHFGKYPTIYLDFSRLVEVDDHRKVEEGIRLIIKKLFQSKFYLFEHFNDTSNHAKCPIEVSLLRTYFKGKVGKNIITSLKDLSQLLTTYHSKEVFVFIDDYDTVYIKMLEQKIFPNKVQFKKTKDILSDMLRILFNTTYKYPVRFYMTGIIPITSDFGGFNVHNYTVFDEKFLQYFGFMENEVGTLLRETNHMSFKKDIDNWYGGYEYFNRKLYNPWSVIQCIKANNCSKMYWGIMEGIDMFETGYTKNIVLQNNLEILLRNGTIELPLYFANFSTALDDGSEGPFFYLAVLAGYINAKKTRKIGNEQYYEISIPNKEVNTVLKSVTEIWQKTFLRKIPRLGSVYESVMKNIKYKNYDNFQINSKKLIDDLPVRFRHNVTVRDLLNHVFLLKGEKYGCELQQETYKRNNLGKLPPISLICSKTVYVIEIDDKWIGLDNPRDKLKLKNEQLKVKNERTWLMKNSTAKALDYCSLYTNNTTYSFLKEIVCIGIAAHFGQYTLVDYVTKEMS